MSKKDSHSLSKYSTIILIIAILVSIVELFFIANDHIFNRNKILLKQPPEYVPYLYEFEAQKYRVDVGNKDAPNNPIVNFSSYNTAIEFTPSNINDSNIKQEKIDAKSVKYNNVWPGIDIIYTVTDRGVKEEIIISSIKSYKQYKQNKGDASFKFDIKPNNALLRKGKIGNNEFYYFIDLLNQSYRFRFEKPFMVDNNGGISNNVGFEIENPSLVNSKTIVENYTFVLTPDEKWLEKAIYPVIIDPSASVQDLYDDTTKIDTDTSSGYTVMGGQLKINLFSWYSGSWNYRMPIDYDNTTGVKTNQDVLVDVDTATLVSAGKLQNDCDDLRFIDSDGSTLLSYWIERGCNTSSTKIWVRLPSVPASTNYTFYMYYGNSSAVSAQESWTGNLIVTYGASLPTGWTSITNFNTGNRFPYGSSSYGTTGGSSASHTHNETGNTSYIDTSSNSGTATWVCTSRHRHTVDVTSTSTTITQKFYTLVYGQTNMIPDALVANSVVAYALSSGSLPAGWSNITNLSSRFPEGSLTYGTTGGSDTHSHTFSTYTTGSAGTNAGCRNGGAGTCLVSTGSTAHTHSLTGATLASKNNEPPYLNVDFANNASSAVFPTSDAIMMFTQLPPLGWTRFADLDGRIPRGSATYGGSGGSTTHDHTSNTGTSSVAGNASSWNCGSGTDWYPLKTTAATWNHDHDFTLNWDAITNIPPYVETIFATRNNSEITTTLGSEVSAPKTSTVQSINLIAGISGITSLNTFVYNLSAKPGGTTASLQFSPDAATWYNASCSSGGTQSLSTGSNTLNLSGACWSTTAFYYKLVFTGDSTTTPVMDDITLNYTYLTVPNFCVLEESPQNDKITVNWGDPNSSEDGYQIDKLTNNSWSSTPYVSVSAGVTTYGDSVSISGGNVYQYRIRAFTTSPAVQSNWCYSPVLSLGIGAFQFGTTEGGSEGLQMEGLKID